MITNILAGLLVLAVGGIAFLLVRQRKLLAEQRGLSQQHTEDMQRHEALIEENAKLKEAQLRYQAIADVEAERERVQQGIKEWMQKFQAQKQAMQERFHQERQEEQQKWRGEQQKWQEERGRNEGEINALQFKVNALRQELERLDEEAHLQSFAFYKPHYDFTNSARYQSELEKIRAQQKQMLKTKTAAVCHIEWSVNGSKVEGRKQINQTLNLLLRAFNGECDAAIAKVRYNNIQVMEERIRKAFKALTSMVEVQQCSIASSYLELKLQELRLVHEYQEKVQAEKEEQRRIREQMREEEIAQRELEKARLDAERDERQYEVALTKARQEAEQAVGVKQQRLLGQIEELQRRLDEAHTNKERAIARAQMTRSGHVYIISNIGSFGEDVFKIGMTRRLDPLDRVRELGDASVPFQFDVHAIIYADDAPTLEAALHRKFADRRINRVNERKEFFRVSIDEVAEVVRQHRADIEIIRDAEAVEYRKTVALLNEIAPSTSKVAKSDALTLVA